LLRVFLGVLKLLEVRLYFNLKINRLFAVEAERL